MRGYLFTKQRRTLLMCFRYCAVGVNLSAIKTVNQTNEISCIHAFTDVYVCSPGSNDPGVVSTKNELNKLNYLYLLHAKLFQKESSSFGNNITSIPRHVKPIEMR